eukprot:scaffold2482_cov145-Skeletonema_dohrnii-CCMP3373.AAC.1
MASFSRTSTWAWWMERPMTCTWSPLEASSRRSALVFLRLPPVAAVGVLVDTLSLRVAASRAVLVG